MNSRENFINCMRKKYSIMSDDTLNEAWKKVMFLCEKYNLDMNDAVFIEGGDSAVLYMFDDLVIKICSHGVELKEYLSHSKHILQPIEEEVINFNFRNIINLPISILLVEKVNTDNISVDDTVRVIHKLLDDNYASLDIKTSNIGVNSEGEYVLLDYGELFYKDYDSNYAEHYNMCLNRLDKFVEIENKLSGRKK